MPFPSSIKFQCPHCTRQVSADVKLAGREALCGKCGLPMTVPGAAPAPIAPPPPASVPAAPCRPARSRSNFTTVAVVLSGTCAVVVVTFLFFYMYDQSAKKDDSRSARNDRRTASPSDGPTSGNGPANNGAGKTANASPPAPPIVNGGKKQPDNNQPPNGKTKKKADPAARPPAPNPPLKADPAADQAAKHLAAAREALRDSRLEPAWLALCEARTLIGETDETKQLAQQIIQQWTKPRELEPVFREDFATTDPGKLPSGWKMLGDDGTVQTSGGKKLLTTVSRGAHTIHTPELEFPPDFELNVATGVKDDGKIKITLIGRQGPNLDILLERRWRTNQITFADADPQERSSIFGTMVMRLIREGNVFQVIIEDQAGLVRNLKAMGDFSKIAFTFSGGARNAWVEYLRLAHHSKLNPPIPAGEFRETFDGAAIGKLPDGWWGGGEAAVRRAKDRSKWIWANNAGMHTVATAPINIPPDFKLDVNAHLEHWSNQRILLRGQGPTPDLAMSFHAKKAFAREDYEWTVSMTGADAKRFILPNGPVRIRLEKDGQTFRLYVVPLKNWRELDNKAAKPSEVFAKPLPDHKRFRRIVFLLEGGDHKSVLGGIFVAPCK